MVKYIRYVIFYLNTNICRTPNPAECECLLRHQHAARPELRAAAAGRHLQGAGQGGRAVQGDARPQAGHQQGEEEAAGAGALTPTLWTRPLSEIKLCCDYLLLSIEKVFIV